jgi:hypothetical protein
MADIRDLKSRGEKSPCGFDSRLGHPLFSSEEGLRYRHYRQILAGLAQFYDGGVIRE